MAVTTEEAAQFIGISADEPLLPDLLAVSVALVDEFLKPSGVARCPASIHDYAVKVLTGEAWQRRNAPGGVASWSPDGAVPVRLSSDTLRVIRPLLDAYRGFGAVG